MFQRNEIAIEDSIKTELLENTKWLSKHYISDGMTSFQLSQLIWIMDYWHVDDTNKVWRDLDKHYNSKANLFEDDYVDPSNSSNVYLTNTYLVEQILRGNSRFNYEVYDSIASACNNQSNIALIDSTNWGFTVSLEITLLETGKANQNDIGQAGQAIGKAITTSALVQSIIRGDSPVNLSNLSTAAILCKYNRLAFGDDKYSVVVNELYNKLNSAILLNYSETNPSFTQLLYVSLQDVSDISSNMFIKSNINDWIINNYNGSMRAETYQAYGME
jgi:hypothetical protein